MAQTDPELADRLKTERRLTRLLGACGPNRAPAGLSRAVLPQLAADRGENATRSTPPSPFRKLLTGFGFGFVTASLLVAGAVIVIHKSSNTPNPQIAAVTNTPPTPLHDREIASVPLE